MNEHITPVDLSKSYRLINHGPTVLVSAHYKGVDNVMAAAWSCGLDFAPPKLTVVIDKETKTRELIEKSGEFAIQVPSVLLAKLTHFVGNTSLRDNPNKIKDSGVEFFRASSSNLPLVKDSIAWLLCKVIPEPHIQETYDLFIGEIVSAYADNRVYKNGHWQFDSADKSLRSLHYIAGGQFYAIGESIVVG